MKDLLAAERYARALFEIVRESGTDAETEAELVSFSEALKAAPEIQKFLDNPYFKIEEKNRLLGKLYSQKNNVILSFFTVLLEKNRFNLIHEVVWNFKRIADAAQGEAAAEITSATVLDAQSERAIVSRLEKVAGFKLAVTKKVDPALLGGVVVKIQHKIWDGSVKSKIQHLKKELIKIRTL